ncbi:MAG: GNAT family protein [Pseudomonadota bacterium]
MTDNDARFMIVPLTVADTQAYLAAVARSRNELSKWLPWAGDSFQPGQGVAWVQSRAQAWSSGQEYSFAAKHPLTGDLLGSASLNRIDWANGCANLGFWTASDAVKTGVATTACRAVGDFAVDTLGLVRIEILTSVHNKGALKVARNADYNREATLKSRLRLPDGLHDAVLYARTR